MPTMNAVDQVKLNNQKELVRLIAEYVTAQIGGTETGKKYLKSLAHPKPETALANFGQTHAGLRAVITSHETDKAKVDKKEEDVVYAFEAMLKSYRGSKDETVAIAIIRDMNQQISTPKGPKL